MRLPNFHNVINIPEGTSGDFSVKHDHRPANTIMPLATARTAIIGGDKGHKINYTFPTRWHELLEGKSRWMTDWPIEQWQMLQSVKPIQYGHVIVGGLGLGVIATWLAKRPRITNVTVVELSQDVINLVWPYLLQDDKEAKAKLHIVQSDLLEYLNRLPPNKQVFTWAFYDIWAGDGEATFFEVVCPLLQSSHGRVKNIPINWNENVMRGQLRLSLTGRYHFAKNKEFFSVNKDDENFPDLERLATPNGSIWVDWSVPFFQWVLRANPTQEQVDHCANIYAANYGRPLFEKYWEHYASR